MCCEGAVRCGVRVQAYMLSASPDYVMGCLMMVRSLSALGSGVSQNAEESVNFMMDIRDSDVEMEWLCLW